MSHSHLLQQIIRCGKKSFYGIIALIFATGFNSLLLGMLFSTTSDVEPITHCAIDNRPDSLFFDWGTQLENFNFDGESAHLASNNILANEHINNYLKILEPTNNAKRPSFFKIRVCFVTTEFVGLGAHGGIGTAFFELAKKLSSSSDFSVSVLYIGNLVENRIANLTRNPIKVYQLPPYDFVIQPDWWAERNYRVLQFLKEHERDFDIVHFPDWGGYGYYSMLAKKQGWAFRNMIFVTGIHGPDEWAALSSKRYPGKETIEMNYYEQQTVEMADAIVGPSSYILKYLVTHGWKVPRRSYMIQNIISVSTHKKPLIPSVIEEIVFFGRLEPRKGIEIVLKAMDILADKMFSRMNYERAKLPFKLTFLGRDVNEPGLGSVQRWIQTYHAASKWSATLLGFQKLDRDAALKYLRHPNRLALIPSLMENSPYTVLECILNDIQFVASDVGGIGELVHPDDRAQVLFKPLPRNLASKLEEVLRTDYVQARPAISPKQTETNWISLHYELFSKMHELVPPKKWFPPQVKVTVCITHHARPRLLMQTLHSFEKQDYSNFDLIVIDDGSPPSVQPQLNKSMHEWVREGRYYYPIENSYVGAARNFCVRKTSEDTKYILFLDDDDVPKSNMISKLVSIAEHNGAEVLTTFFDVFVPYQVEDDPTEVKSVQWRHIYAFAGPSQSLGFVGNYLGGANIFVNKESFHKIGGFTEYQAVGFEDYEFLVRSGMSGLKHQIVPDPLLWVRNTPGSMAKRDKRFLGEYRVLVPYLNNPKYRELNDFFLYSKHLINSQHMDTSRRIFADSAASFSSKQGVDGWWYGFRKIGSTDATFDPARAVTVGESWKLRGSPTEWPYISALGMHPIYSHDNNQLRYQAIRRWISMKQGRAVMKISVGKGAECGNGVRFSVEVDGTTFWSHEDHRATSHQAEVDIVLEVGTVIDMVVDPLGDDSCDSVAFSIQIYSDL